MLLGRARLAANNPTGTNFIDNLTNGGARGVGVGVEYVEGFQTLAKAAYGGTNNNDDSGVMRFCSIRYAGYVHEEGNEINGLTLGAVGRGTTLEFIEVFNSADDGLQFLGGTVDGKYLASVFSGVPTPMVSPSEIS